MSQKIENTFSRSIDQVAKLHKVFRENGQLEQAMMDQGADISTLRDVQQKLNEALEVMEQALYDADGNQDLSEDIITEGVLDGDDEDGFMARSQLYFLARDAIALHGMIGDRDNLEPWIQSKIAQCSQAIDAARRYTEYQEVKAMAPGHDPEEMDVDEGFKILEPIDRERYQERDGLEGPFRFGGKVLYYDPREGQYYDPDTDIYLSHDEWEALAKSDENFAKTLDLPEGLNYNAVFEAVRLYNEGVITDEHLQQLEEGTLTEQNINEVLPAIPAVVAGLATAGRVAAPIIARLAAKYGPQVLRGIASGGKNAVRLGRTGLQKAKDLLKGKKSTKGKKTGKKDGNDFIGFPGGGDEEDAADTYRDYAALDRFKTGGSLDGTVYTIGDSQEYDDEMVDEGWGKDAVKWVKGKFKKDPKKVPKPKSGRNRVIGDPTGLFGGGDMEDAINQDRAIKAGRALQAMKSSYEPKGEMLEGDSPHPKGSAKYKKHMAAKHAAMANEGELSMNEVDVDKPRDASQARFEIGRLLDDLSRTISLKTDEGIRLSDDLDKLGSRMMQDGKMGIKNKSDLMQFLDTEIESPKQEVIKYYNEAVKKYQAGERFDRSKVKDPTDSDAYQGMESALQQEATEFFKAVKNKAMKETKK